MFEENYSIYVKDVKSAFCKKNINNNKKKSYVKSLWLIGMFKAHLTSPYFIAIKKTKLCNEKIVFTNIRHGISIVIVVEIFFDI